LGGAGVIVTLRHRVFLVARVIVGDLREQARSYGIGGVSHGFEHFVYLDVFTPPTRNRSGCMDCSVFK
jgi:hypothetical protein